MDEGETKVRFRRDALDPWKQRRIRSEPRIAANDVSLERGAPAKAIQKLAGHADLTTTMRYMHLSPAARQDAIALLNARDDDGANARSAIPSPHAASTTARD